MDKIYNDTITIESVEQKDNRISILAHNNKRYSFWTTRKSKDEEGNPILDVNKNPVLEDSSPYLQFKRLELKKGSTVRIGFKIEDYEIKGIKRQAYKIINFAETNEEPTQTSVPKETPHQGPNFESERTPRPDWDEIAVGKCQTNFISAFISAGHSFEEAKAALPEARDLAELVVYGPREQREAMREMDEQVPFNDEEYQT